MIPSQDLDQTVGRLDQLLGPVQNCVQTGSHLDSVLVALAQTGDQSFEDCNVGGDIKNLLGQVADHEVIIEFLLLEC